MTLAGIISEMPMVAVVAKSGKDIVVELKSADG